MNQESGVALRDLCFQALRVQVWEALPYRSMQLGAERRCGMQDSSYPAQNPEHPWPVPPNPVAAAIQNVPTKFRTSLLKTTGLGGQ